LFSNAQSAERTVAPGLEARARAVEGRAQVQRVGDGIQHRLGRDVRLVGMQCRRELDLVGAEFARELEPVLDGAVGVRVADLARRQLLECGGKDTQPHESGLEALGGCHSKDLRPVILPDHTKW